MTTQNTPAGTSLATNGLVNTLSVPARRAGRGGAAGGILHIGLFFVPALVVLAVGGVKLWREPSRPGGRYQR
jgi:hypothetical protein